MSPVLAVLEVLDRDGAVRQSVSVREWPLRAGRALDNELVLDDPHTAPLHFSVAPGEDGALGLTVGESLNGVQLGSRRLAAGERFVLSDGPDDIPAQLVAGRTHLRLRLAGQALPPEQPLGATRAQAQGLPRLALLLLATALVLGFGTWLDSEPDLFVRALGSFAVSALAIGLGWSGLWTLLSKVFTRQGHFGWHLGVMLAAVLAWELMVVATGLIAFAFSWPWVTDFNFILGFAILGAMLYFHLQAVEPLHPKRTLGFAVGAAVMGTALTLWFNLQGSDRAGSELYMTHLFPPALRVAKPVDVPTFMQEVAGLQATLDTKAKKEDGDE
jgi:hypothetical protein